MNLDQLSIHCWCPRDSSWSQTVNSSYLLWDEVWTSTFLQLDGQAGVYSDEFDRQDIIISLSFGKRVIGLICHRYRDMKLDHWRADSYFRKWPEQAMRELSRDGHRLCIGSNITVDPEFRGRTNGFSAKDLLMTASLAYHRDQHPVDAITGTMRNDKRMADLFYELGAEPLVHDVLFHGVSVDLISFFPQSRGIHLSKFSLNMVRQLLERGRQTLRSA